MLANRRTAVGFSETAFLFPDPPAARWSPANRERRGRPTECATSAPLAEVPFCGHATIATAVAHADRNGVGRLDLEHPRQGRCRSEDTRRRDQRIAGHIKTSVTPLDPGQSRPTSSGAGPRGRWAGPRTSSMVSLPPRVAFAGARHPVLAVRSRQVLAELDYDYAALAAIMAEQDWTTLQLVQRERRDDVFHARNPFPARRRGRGPGHRCGRRSPRRLPAVARPGPGVEAGEHPPGPRHGKAESAARGNPRPRRHQGQRLSRPDLISTGFRHSKPGPASCALGERQPLTSRRPAPRRPRGARPGTAATTPGRGTGRR